MMFVLGLLTGLPALAGPPRLLAEVDLPHKQSMLTNLKTNPRVSQVTSKAAFVELRRPNSAAAATGGDILRQMAGCRQSMTLREHLKTAER
ncbi:hypothetical protein [Arthrobacter sp. 9AX]|uniref:hypothetical protein n=1 Tax=Arthrobacter sp. 9AX TaxID=2653131 RepID=UPI001358AE2B|nr:hypothetical protein [Arthrobacter sp. 9AX]